MTKKVAIGLPVYNGEAFLAEAIESILGQSFGDFDLIVADNASTDKTEALCQRYAQRDKRVRYIRRPRNIGAGLNFDSVYRMADAPYFKWAAHDDVLAPGFLAACVTALDADPDVILAMPATVLIDEHGAPLPFSAGRGGHIDSSGVCWAALPEKSADLASADPVARFAALVMHMILCVEIFGVMRRSALKRTLMQGSYLGSDKVMLAELCLRGRFWLGSEPMFFRRCHPKQYSIAGKSDRYRAAWWGGVNARLLTHTLMVQKLIFLADYCRRIGRSPLTPKQRAACLRIVLHRALMRGKTWLGVANAELDGFYPATQAAPATKAAAMNESEA